MKRFRVASSTSGSSSGTIDCHIAAISGISRCFTNRVCTPVSAASSGRMILSSSQSSAIRSGSGNGAEPGLRRSTLIANEWTVLGRSTSASWAATFPASSAVAARVNVSSRIRGWSSWRASSQWMRSTTVTDLPVPGPASTRPWRSGSCARIFCCSGVGSYSIVPNRASSLRSALDVPLRVQRGGPAVGAVSGARRVAPLSQRARNGAVVRDRDPPRVSRTRCNAAQGNGCASPTAAKLSSSGFTCRSYQSGP